MRKKQGWLILPAILLALAIIGYAAVRMLFVFPAGQPVFRNAKEADLRDTSMTVEEYRVLASQMPQCHILWMIPIGGTQYDCTASRIVVDDIDEADIPLFSLFEHLEYVDARNARCYENLLALQSALPDCTVDWTVQLGSGTFDPDSESLDLQGTGTSAPELSEKLQLFPNLTEVIIVDADYSADQQDGLRRKYSDVTFVWPVEVSGKRWLNTETCLFYGGSTVNVPELIAAAPDFPNVQELDLRGCGCTVEELLALQEAYQVPIRCELELYGEKFSTDATEIDFSGIRIQDTAPLEQMLPLLPKLEKVDMCNCGLSNTAMDELGQRHPDVRFVWKVKVGGVYIRTDITSYIGARYGYYPKTSISNPWADAGNRLFNKDVANLRYCVDMICLDLGHMGVTDYSFLNYMPKLKYLILADTRGKDFSMIGNLTELIYLELFMTYFTDTEILLNLTKLENLNLGHTFLTNPEVLAEMSWVDMMWIPGTTLDEDLREEIAAALPDTQVVSVFGGSTNDGWRQCQNYYDMRDILGMPYYK